MDRLAFLFSHSFVGASVAGLLFLLAAAQGVGAELLKVAQSVDPKSRFADYLRIGEGNFGLMTAAFAMDKKLGIQCNYQADAKNLKIAVKGLRLRSDVKFPAEAKHPTNGNWVVRYEFRRCGETAVYNTIFAARRENSPKLLNLLPGYSAMGPSLMGRVARQLLVEVRRAHLETDCSDIQVIDTSKPTREKEEKAVIEIWSVKACEQPIDFSIVVMPEVVGQKKIEFAITRLGEPATP